MNIEELTQYIQQKDVTDGLKKVLLEVKEKQKDRAKRIRFLRDHRKLAGQRSLHRTHRSIQCEERGLSWEYRHYHLAYCLIRGRTYSDIEPCVCSDNKPSFSLLEKNVREILGE